MSFGGHFFSVPTQINQWQIHATDAEAILNRHTLIDAIIRQTMVLIARLATAGGVRTPLAHIAGQVFLELSKELKAGQLGSKVIADMFGLTLRAYNAKLRRLEDGKTERGRSLWQAVLSFVGDRTAVSRRELFSRFHYDDRLMVQGVVNDLVESGLLFRSGRGPTTLYRLVTLDDVDSSAVEVSEGLLALLWSMVYRMGPLTLGQLQAELPTVPEHVLSQTLDQLVQQAKVRCHKEDELIYDSEECIIPLERNEGWEAAIFDHFQAMINVIAKRAEGVAGHDLIGGSTFHFDIHDLHPHEDEVLSLLKEIRTRVSALRKRVDEHNREHAPADKRPYRVVFYLGQNVIADCQSGEEETE